MSRPNRCIKDENGTELWISRSSVVIPIVFKMDEKTGDIYTLLEQRGEIVTHTGEWCCPCGYIDWDETLEEACQREVKEETGLQLDIKNIYFFAVDTNKYSKTQAIDHWYMCWVKDDRDFDMDEIETKDEVFDVEWLKVANVSTKWSLFKGQRNKCTIYKKNIYDGLGTWAFKQHKIYIVKMLKKVFEDWKIDIIDE